MSNINVIGAGLAGSEAALQIAEFGYKLNLFEMKPKKKSGAHKLDGFAELVCSNSLKSKNPNNAHGLLKQELLILNSYLIKTAFKTAIPSGNALSVDRKVFSDKITELIINNPNINLIHKEITEINTDDINVICCGPLITENLFTHLSQYLDNNSLFFYDAIAPIIYTDSINLNSDSVIKGQRYSETESDDYINCLMNKQEYLKFYNELINAELYQPANFEKNHFFQGCMPVEEIAKKGIDTLRFGCMKPVGFRYKNGDIPYAVVQLRKENKFSTIYNMVGFQTRLKYGEQEKIFRLIPGLENAEFARKGSMHRNSYINSPTNLTKNLCLKNHPNIFIAGQLTGVEGYVESIATGLIAGINVINKIENKDFINLPDTTMVKSIINYITDENNNKNFQPMNANFGIIPKLQERVRNKKLKYQKYAERSINDIRLQLDLKI